MQKPRDPNEPGGAMTAVAMIISLGIAPVTAVGMCIGAVIGIAGGISQQVLEVLHRVCCGEQALHWLQALL